jgi:mannose-6-phosphate isomerase-like protein (cupin superfamily)
MSSGDGRRATVDEVLRLIPTEGVRSAAAFSHGTLTVKLYAPRGTDPQQPHLQDEVYVVVRGSGRFFCAGERTPFGPGDLLFVPARIEHRFEDFTDDLTVWVVFYGPQGGERP